eukprot:gene9645-9805_t
MGKHNGKSRSAGGVKVGAALTRRHKADLADRDFTAERYQPVVISTSAHSALAAEQSAAVRAEVEARNCDKLIIPRRKLAVLEEDEGLTLTPFERNLEVWRQLWRVLERSDIVVQVVDARDPLTYYSQDLVDYALELNPTKTSFILLNKADLLPEAVRGAWADYFDSKGVKYGFWSAFVAAEAQAKVSREQLRQEVQTVLAMRTQGDDAAGQRLSSSAKLVPGTPGNHSSDPHTHLMIESSIADSREHNSKPTPTMNGAQEQLEGSNHSRKSANTTTKPWLADVKGQDSSTAQDGKQPARLSIGASLKRSLEGVSKVVREKPYTLLVSLLATLLLIAAGVVGVLAAANTETRHRKGSAIGFANNAASAFEVQLQQTFAPLTALSVLIHFQPYYPAIAEAFDGIAQELLASQPVPDAIASLQASPAGIVRSFYPLKGNEKALNHNLFKDPARRTAALETVRRGVLTLQGPLKLLQGYHAAIARMPIFIYNVSNNETFGGPNADPNSSSSSSSRVVVQAAKVRFPYEPYNCDICYNETTRTKFWGFVSCVVKLQDLADGKDTRLNTLSEMGYNFEFFAPQLDMPVILIASTPDKPVEPVEAQVNVPGNAWVLRVAPQQGWIPVWRDPMLATVIIVSLFIGALIFATLVSRCMQKTLLVEMQASNKALEEEKRRMDVLLARQYNLISCMAQQGSLAAGSDNLNTLEQKTLNRIVELRREIGVSSTTSSGDKLQLLELLGEGSFGKVHKGVWRGSTVAIKTMILPAKMSGAEKRERMAIMEAAISSTMAHPNIVQTYTYTIKSATASGATPASAGGAARDALDQGGFYSSGGALNYGAILDTAADVAKAMLHLHCHQVIHSDLKVRNVLLKSDGSSDRGCIAKVADFGLAVKMDSHDTHVSAFQGTMSHTAPEVLLRGHISKAADVYSYGITLWELFTAGHAYHGIPRALLGHQVAMNGLRPTFPDFTPHEYRALAERCWQPEPEARPGFQEILETLQRIRKKFGKPTQPMVKTVPQPSLLVQRERAEIDAVQLSAASQNTNTSGQERKVFAAQDAGLVQLQSFYVDGSSMDQSSFMQHHHHAAAGASDVEAGIMHGDTADTSGGAAVPGPAGPLMYQASNGQLQQYHQHHHQHTGPGAAAAAGLSPRHARDVGSPKLETIDDDESQTGESRSHSRALPEVVERQQLPAAGAAAADDSQQPHLAASD